MATGNIDNLGGNKEKLQKILDPKNPDAPLSRHLGRNIWRGT